MNNLALAKILHHFYNSRLSVKQLDQLDNIITDAVRELFSLYKSTTRIVIFLPRENGGLGIKRISDVYRSTRLAFLIKMLNHDVMHFRHIARSSLELDMKKRGVRPTDGANNFLGYELTDDGFLACNTNFGCQSDWPDMVRYARSLNVDVKYVNDKAMAHIKGTWYDNQCELQK